MEGMCCPNCNKPSQWLNTTNEYEYYCPSCKFRFNKLGEKMNDSELKPARCKVAIFLVNQDFKATSIAVSYTPEEVYKILSGDNIYNVRVIDGKRFVYFETCYNEEPNPSNSRQIVTNNPEIVCFELSRLIAFAIRDLEFKAPESSIVLATPSLPKDLLKH